MTIFLYAIGVIIGMAAVWQTISAFTARSSLRRIMFHINYLHAEDEVEVKEVTRRIHQLAHQELGNEGCWCRMWTPSQLQKKTIMSSTNAG